MADDDKQKGVGIVASAIGESAVDVVKGGVGTGIAGALTGAIAGASTGGANMQERAVRAGIGALIGGVSGGVVGGVVGGGYGVYKGAVKHGEAAEQIREGKFAKMVLESRNNSPDKGRG